MKRLNYATLFTAILIVGILFLSACRRNVDDIPEIITTPTTPTPPKADLENTEVIDSLDIQKVDFKSSTSRLTFSTIVKGYALSDGSFNSMSLTNSGWTHPSVLYFKDGWNNYKYWMSITPYPYAMAEYENPTIFCSNDGYNWKEPAGLVNPIERAPEKPGYNSDVNLFYENGKMYCFWRAVCVFEPSLNRIAERSLYFRSSTDGVHWTDKQFITTWNYTGVDLIAPSVIKHADKYYCYGVSTGETKPGSYYTNYGIRRMVYDNFRDFQVDKAKGYDLINIEGRPWGEYEEPWHTEVRKYKNMWFLLVATTRNAQYGSQGRLFLGYSKDGINFKFHNKPICNEINVYKSSFLLFEDPVKKVLTVKLWRAASGDWSIYYDEFPLTEFFSKT